MEFTFHKLWDYLGGGGAVDPLDLARRFTEHQFLRYLFSGQNDPRYSVYAPPGEPGESPFQIDRDRFLAHFQASCGSTRPGRGEFFELFHLAYCQACGQDPSEVRVIVDNCHGFSRIVPAVATIREDFPDARIIVMSIRDPRASYNSTKEMLRAQYGAMTFEGTISNFDRHIRNWAEIHDLRRLMPADNLCLMQFEQLHTTPEETMRRLCLQLGIDFHPTLLRSTVAGRTWWGNSSTGEKVSDFSTDRIRPTWQKSLNHNEIAIIEYFLGEPMSRYGYARFLPQRPSFLSLFLLNKSERQAYAGCTHYLATRYREFRQLNFSRPIDRFLAKFHRTLPFWAHFFPHAATFIILMAFMPLEKIRRLIALRWVVRRLAQN